MTEDIRKNIKGRRSRLNRVRDVKMTEASSEWPVAEYVTKAMTDARAGKLIATAFIAARTSRMVRIYLQRS